MLLDKWATLFLAWPDGKHFYYQERVESFYQQGKVVVSDQIIKGLRRDIGVALEVAKDYELAVSTPSVEGFLRFFYSFVNEHRRDARYSQMCGIIRLLY